MENLWIWEYGYARSRPRRVVRWISDSVKVSFYAWHLIGGRFVLWTVQLKPEVGGTPKELGRFGGGGYD